MRPRKGRVYGLNETQLKKLQELGTLSQYKLSCLRSLCRATLEGNTVEIVAEIIKISIEDLEKAYRKYPEFYFIERDRLELIYIKKKINHYAQQVNPMGCRIREAKGIPNKKMCWGCANVVNLSHKIQLDLKKIGVTMPTKRETPITPLLESEPLGVL